MTASCSITSGPATLLAWGTVTTFDGQPLTWRLAVRDVVVEVQLGFRSASPPLPALHARPTPTGWLLEACDLDGATPRGTATPLLLGAVGPDLVWLHLRVHRFGATPDHTVHYTFFLAPEASVPSPRDP